MKHVRSKWAFDALNLEDLFFSWFDVSKCEKDRRRHTIMDVLFVEDAAAGASVVLV